MRFGKRALAIVTALGLSTALPPTVFNGSTADAAASSVGNVAKASLNRRMPEVRFDNVGLGDALDFIRDVSGANIVVNWKALAEGNVTKETAINVRLYGVSLKKALSVVLSEAGAGSSLTYTVEDNIIEITTQQLADQKMYVRIYNIEDLLMEIPSFDNAPDFNLQSQGQGGQGGGQGNTGGGLLGGGGMGTDKDKEVTKTKTERAEELMLLIRETIRPEVWRDNGGTAAIRYFNGNLVITAPLQVHEMIGG